MRPCLIKVRYILAQNVPQVRLAQDEQMIQTLLAHGTEEPLAHGVLFGCAIGGAHERDATGVGHLREG